MYKLYWRERSGAFAPAAVMAELDIPYEPVRVETDTREHESAAYRALNPMAQIPTLVLPEGTVMTESAAIALYLAETRPEIRPGGGLAPPPGDARRAAFLRWLFFAQTNIYETDLRFSYAERYTSDPKGAEAVAEAARARYDRLWAMTSEAVAGPFFFGESFTLLDIYLAMLATWHYDPPGFLAGNAVVRRLLEATAARPASGEVWRRYRMHDKMD